MPGVNAKIVAAPAKNIFRMILEQLAGTNCERPLVRKLCQSIVACSRGWERCHWWISELRALAAYLSAMLALLTLIGLYIEPSGPEVCWRHRVSAKSVQKCPSSPPPLFQRWVQTGPG